MNRWKICSAALTLALAAGLLSVPASNAQSIPVVAVGSSGFFGASGLAAIKGDPIRGTSAGLCGDRFWTGTLTGLDSRKATNSSIPNESASAWVAWDNDAAPTIICAYLAPDSIIGQRLFFGQDVGGNATLSIPTSACTTAGANKIAFIWDTATSGLPVKVWNALQGGNATLANCSDNTNTLAPVHFNVAFSDVRSEDAQFVANNRIFCADSNSTASFPPDDKSCLGFGGSGGLGTGVVSSYSTSSANVVNYSYTGTDPISGKTIPAAQIVPVGAQAMLVFVNIANQTSGSGGFGDLYLNGAGSGTPKLTNVDSHALSAMFSGQAVLTRDIYGYPNAPVAAAHALLREPPSGTYTTFEWQVVRQRDGNTAFSQETGILGPSQSGYSSACFVQSTSAYPSSGSPCSNPVNVVLGSSGALRSRVIGTGQMISVGNTAALPDSIGYAFWSLGNYGNKQNMRYLTLDGVDGLFPSYSTHNGVFPGGVTGQGTSAIMPAPTAGQCGGYFNGDGGATITTFSCNSYALPTFDGLQSGAYRLWNVVQANYYSSSPITPTFSPLNITGFILSAQNQANPVNPNLPDIIATTYCGDSACTPSLYKHPVNYFRSHYTAPSWGLGNSCNGVQSSGCAENGGDVAGALISRQAEIDFGNIFSNSFTSWVQ